MSMILRVSWFGWLIVCYFAFQPALAADIGRIVFASDRDGNREIYLARDDGSEQMRLTFDVADDDHPSLSPDGQWVAFSSNREGRYEIFLMEVDGSGLHRLTTGATGNTTRSIQGTDWHPDGGRLIFSARKDDPDPVFGLYEVSVESGETALLSDLGLDVFHPKYSVDGSKIYTQRNTPGQQFGTTEVWVSSADGSGSTLLTATPTGFGSHTPNEMVANGVPKVVFTRNSGGLDQIHIMELDGSGVLNISNNNNPEIWPVSARGVVDELLFFDASSFPRTLWKMKSDGSARVQLTTEDVISQDWWVGPDFASTVMLATNSAWLKQSSAVLSGSIIVDGPVSGTFLTKHPLTIGVNVSTSEESEVKADSIKTKLGSTVSGDTFYNELDSNGEILGQMVTPLELPVFRILPVFQAGVPGEHDIEVGRNQFLVLDEGSYGDVRVKRGGSVFFTGGIYNLRSLEGGQGAILSFEAASQIRIAEKFATGQHSYVGPAAASAIGASDIVFYVAGINGNNGSLGATPKAAKIGVGNTVAAAFYAPNGTLHLRQGTVANGTYIARDVIVGVGVQVALESFLH